MQGTARLDSGAIDKATKQLEKELSIPASVWWRDDINRRLDNAWDIKLRYSEVLSGHDFFRLLLETTAGQEHERRMNALRAFLAEQYSEDMEVKFKQVELSTKLLDLFVDLPFRFRLPITRADLSKHPLKLSCRIIQEDSKSIVITNHQEERSVEGTATLLLTEFSDACLNQVVVEGAPGQGKSTLAQYLCQVHRIRLLDKEDDLSKVPESDRHFSCKIPFKVDLRDLAAWLEGTDPFVASLTTASEARSLESFLARLVRHASGGLSFDVNDLLQLSKLAPFLIVLDGLDEVVDIKQRADVIASVNRALPRLKENCPGLSIVVTSRPAAFANSPGFDHEQFVYVDLLSLKRAQIDQYANNWMDVRGLNAKERVEFEQVLKEKLDAPHLRDLSRNPMQLTILLSLVLTQGSALPDKRTHLYDNYVDLFFSRESAKNAAVRKHIDLLKDLHRYVAWVLHSTAETSRRSSAGRISADELKTVILEYLAREHHPTDVVEEIFGTMLARVVMIVPRIQGTYEFEVQPLREYFAGRYLYDTASYSPPGKERKGTKPDRFDTIARNFYWLNVVRFFCGCFSKGEHLDLADRVKELIADPMFGQSRHSVTLAAMLLSDWVFTQSPKAVKQITDVLSTTDGLRRIAATGTGHRSNEVIRIPARSGGGEIFKAAFQAIEVPQLQFDQRAEFATIVRAHGTESDIDTEWWRSPLSTTDVVAWSGIGRLVGSLQRVDRDTFLNKVGEIGATKSIDALAAAGRFDCILTSEANASLLWYQVLAGERYFSNHEIGEPPFFLVPLVIDFDPFGPTYFHRHGFGDGIEKFRKIAAQDELPKECEFKFVHECFEASKEIAAAFSSGAITGSKLVDLLEDCRRRWGSRPAIVSSAIKMWRYESHRRMKLGHVSLTNNSEAIVSRLRAAKVRSKDINWWTEQIKQAKSLPFPIKLFVLVASSCILTPQNLLQLQMELSGLLDDMNSEQWAATAGLMSRHIDRGSFSGVPRRSNVSLPTIKSTRFAYLLALKSPRATSRQLFLTNLLGAQDENLSISEFRQLFALDAALSGELEWAVAIKIIRQTYVRGAAYTLRRFSVPSRLLPKEIIDVVLRNPAKYPAAMWDIAVDAASAEARKAVRAVGPIAKAERWFGT